MSEHPATRDWDPGQYARFRDHRNRPFADLLGRVGATAPRRVVDLGCGDGSQTATLAHRWPGAEIVGVDSSPAMIDRARSEQVDQSIDWWVGDVRDWRPSGEDVVVTNATLQWVPGHLDLVRSWLGALPAGGWFAMQVPGNFDAPSHRIIREVAAAQPRGAELSATLRHGDAVEAPATYAAAVTEAGLVADAWETTYVQLLDPQEAQANPVLEWVMGTALRPVLAAFDRGGPDGGGPDAAGRERFLTELDDALAAAYPRTVGGVAFPFRRIFVVAHRASA